MFRTVFFLLVCLLLAAVACKEKNGNNSQELNSEKPLTPAQEEANRRNLMFDQSPGAKLLPAELVPFVNNPYVTYDFEQADLNLDGLEDYILVLAQPSIQNGEDNLNSVSDDEPAPVVVILRQNDKTLRFHSSNNKVFTLEDLTSQELSETGIYADTLGNGFNLYINSHGAGANASFNNTTYRFKFDKKSNKFYLAETTEETGYVSPGAAITFMKGQPAEDSSTQNKEMLSEDEFYENDVKKVKFKVGKIWFSNFKFQ